MNPDNEAVSGLAAAQAGHAQIVSDLTEQCRE